MDGVPMEVDGGAVSLSLSSSSSSSSLLLLPSLLLEVVLVRPRDNVVRRLANSWVVVEVEDGRWCDGRVEIACRIDCFVTNPLNSGIN